MVHWLLKFLKMGFKFFLKKSNFFSSSFVVVQTKISSFSKSIQHLDKAINSTTINMSGNTPIQMIFVNTRLFIKAFHKITHKRPSATSFDAPLSVTSGNINPFRLSAYGNANVGGAQIHSPRVPIFSNSQFTLEQYAAYKCLSYLIPWHLDKQLDIEIINKLQLIRPDPNFSYGVSG